MDITGAFPGGNIRVLSMEGHQAVLDNELRDTRGDWFYWCFQATFPEVGRYEFHFASPNRLCTRGPALSLDDGETWSWLSDDYVDSTQDFAYDCPVAGLRVMFCMGMQYLQRDWERFVKEAQSASYFRPGMLCRSRKGRQVEMAEICEGKPPLTLLLTSRHHAGEMMATHALEGILRFALKTSAFRSRMRVIAVPFVDKDGVEDGDQGKNRLPRDHARDYLDESIYPETAAIRRLIEDEPVDMVLDMHCPWIRSGGTNEASYLVAEDNPRQAEIMDHFGAILEQECGSSTPYYAKDNIPFGVGWNTAANYTLGWTVDKFAGSRSFMKFSQTIEIPFANFGDVTVDRESMLEFGASIARALLKLVDARGWSR